MPSSAPEAVAEVDVGERLRSIRRLRRATLRTIAERAGVSESFLSQVERGKASASIGSLRRIATALGVSVADLFEPSAMPAPRVLRPDERPALAVVLLWRQRLPGSAVRHPRAQHAAADAAAGPPRGVRRRARRRRFDRRRSVRTRRLRG